MGSRDTTRNGELMVEPNKSLEFRLGIDFRPDLYETNRQDWLNAAKVEIAKKSEAVANELLKYSGELKSLENIQSLDQFIDDLAQGILTGQSEFAVEEKLTAFKEVGSSGMALMARIQNEKKLFVEKSLSDLYEILPTLVPELTSSAQERFAACQKAVKEMGGAVGAKALDILDAARKKGLLRPLIETAIFKLKADEPKESNKDLAIRLTNLIESELWLRENHDASPEKHAERAASFFRKHLVTADNFGKMLSKTTDAKITTGNAVTLLSDPAEAMQKRINLIGELAEGTIEVAAWAFGEDSSAELITNSLIKAVQEANDRGAKITVRVLVDGKTSQLSHYGSCIKKLERADTNGGLSTIEVVRSGNPKRPYDGSHCKIFAVNGLDREGKELHASIMGGRNYSDHYFWEQGVENPTEEWTDMDVLLEGAATAPASSAFRQVWNREAKNQDRPDIQIDEPRTGLVTRKSASDHGQENVAVVSDAPGTHRDAQPSNSLWAHLVVIESATKTLDIPNAYFVNFPAVREAIVRAIERGVEVRIFTNSNVSIDEPIVSLPILAELASLQAEANKIDSDGLKIYLKSQEANLKPGEQTLHTKEVVADETRWAVGSYNYHLRSEYLEAEDVVIGWSDNPNDSDTAHEIVKTLEQGIDDGDGVHETGEKYQLADLTRLESLIQHSPKILQRAFPLFHLVRHNL